MNRTPILAVALLLVVACQVQAGLLVNLDLTTNTNDDPFSGAAVFGTAASKWNEVDRSINPASPIAVTDDTGASTSVTVSYSRTNSGLKAVSGTYMNLGRSSIETGSVTISGLAANKAYDLVIYSAWRFSDGAPPASFTVLGVTKSLAVTNDWSSLTEGIQYVRFNGISSGAGGSIGFLPGDRVTSLWSGFQIREVVTSVPEPGTIASMSLGLVALVGFTRRKFASVR